MLGIPELTKAITTNTTAVKQLRAELADATAVLAARASILTAAIESLVKILSGPPSPTGPVIFVPISEASGMINYKVTLPALPATPEAADVVKGELRLSYNGAAQPAIETAVGQTEIASLGIEENTLVEGSFVFIDNAGNPSQNPVAVTAFTASDTIPPPDPEGGVGFQAISES